MRDDQAREPAVIEPVSDREERAPSDEVFPHIRLVGDTVEIDGIVPIDCHHPDTPHIYLEVIACAPDTREHEALVMTRATPSQVHAALLLQGFTAGAPGKWFWEGRQPRYTPPKGDALDVFLRVTRPDGAIDERPVQEWIVDVKTERHPPDAPFRFAGSRFVQYQGNEVYDADYAGNVVGLATFGNEVVGWTEVFSPESAVDEPRWIANTRVVPEFGTPVTIILKPR